MASPQGLFVRLQYPQSIGPLSEDELDNFLRSIQKTQVLYDYECTLNTLTFPSNETVVPMNTPSLYCKTAPSYVTTRAAVSATKADLIINTIDDLIRKQLLPEKSNVSIKILVSSINSGPTQEKSSLGSDHLPLPYYHLHESAAPRVNYSVILLAFLCLGILLLNFALQFHFQ